MNTNDITLGFILALVAGITFLLVSLYQQRRLTIWEVAAPLSVAVHGLVFLLFTIIRHWVMGAHGPSVLISTWSGLWRLHAMSVIFGILLVMWQDTRRDADD